MKITTRLTNIQPGTYIYKNGNVYTVLGYDSHHAWYDVEDENGNLYCLTPSDIIGSYTD